MYVTCLDLEGVLVPEIWIAFAEKTGISDFRRTTRDEPDYNKLMNWRIDLLKKHGLGLKEIQSVIAEIKPMDGAKEFMKELRRITQVIILSDTFTQFALPLMEQLDMPTIFCNELVVGNDGVITGFKLRQDNGKFHAVKALQDIGFKVIAGGDSFNDLGMIHQAEKGFLFRSTEKIIADNPEIQAFTQYSDLLETVRKVVKA
ncbi:MAG: bifunctional phosphoserine phosphatase/homoserine phosphotransferase ThrH [Treponemataceae bacterium]